MMLKFDLALVRRLLEHSKAATERNPNHDQLYRADYRRDATDVDLDAIDATNYPTVADVDPTKIPPGLWLAGDCGIYLMSNGRPALLDGEHGTRDLVSHAEETSDTVSPAMRDAIVSRSFGRDTGCIVLDLRFCEALVACGRDGRVCIRLTPAAVAVMVPASGVTLRDTTPAPRRAAPRTACRRA